MPYPNPHDTPKKTWEEMQSTMKLEFVMRGNGSHADHSTFTTIAVYPEDDLGRCMNFNVWCMYGCPGYTLYFQQMHANPTCKIFHEFHNDQDIKRQVYAEYDKWCSKSKPEGDLEVDTDAAIMALRKMFELKQIDFEVLEREHES